MIGGPAVFKCIEGTRINRGLVGERGGFIKAPQVRN